MPFFRDEDHVEGLISVLSGHLSLGQVIWSITSDEYDKKALQLKQRQKEITFIKEKHVDADEVFAFTVGNLLNLASRAYELFLHSKPEQKRQLVSFVLSNLTLKGKELHYEAKKPFDAILECAESEKWWSTVEDSRTFI